jgi:hypothetical protein
MKKNQQNQQHEQKQQMKLKVKEMVLVEIRIFKRTLNTNL